MGSASRIADSNTVDFPFLPSRKKLHKSFDILIRCFRCLSFFRPNFAFSFVVFASAPFSFHERLRMERDILKGRSRSLLEFGDGRGAVGSAAFSLRLSLSVALVDPANYPEEARRCFNYF
jgi:hypothetical protein